MYTVKGNVVRARETCDIMVHWPPLFCDTRANLGLATYPKLYASLSDIQGLKVSASEVCH